VYLTKDEFLQKFGILPQEFEEADISWEELLEIADDYERHRPTLEKIRKEFVAEFLQDKEKEIGLQSYHSRLKDTEHLVEKLVRKRLENYAKYRKMDATNYMRYVTDLIGIRGLLLYREDWVNFHKYITHWFKNDPEKYIRDYGRDYGRRLSEAGFDVEEIDYVRSLSPEAVKLYGLRSEIVYVVRKRSERAEYATDRPRS